MNSQMGQDYDSIDSVKITVESAFISPNAGGLHTLTLTSRQILYPSMDTKKLMTVYKIDTENKQITQTAALFELPTDILLLSNSPSGKKHVKVTSTKLEVTGECGFEKSIGFTSQVQFLYLDLYFGKISWSCDESTIAFIAEPIPQDQYEYSDDFGDQLAGKRNPSMFTYSILDNEIQRIPVSDSVYPQFPCFDPIGNILFTGLIAQPYKLGLFANPTRQSRIFMYNQSSKQTIQLTKEHTCAGLKFHPSYNKFYYFYQNRTPIFHNTYFGIKCLDLASKAITTLVDQDKEPIIGYQLAFEQTGFIGDEFYFTTHHQGKLETRCLNSKNEVSKVTPNELESSEIIHVSHNIVIIRSSQTNRLPTITAKVSDAFIPVVMSPSNSITESLKEAKRFIITTDTSSGILYVPAKRKAKSPLVINIHGGPHSDLPDVYYSPYALLLHHGYSILTINFRGTIGFGQKYIDAIQGHISDYEIADVAEVTISALAQHPELDSKNVFVMALSFGGSIACLLASHPEYGKMFRAGAVKNPLTSISDSISGSDVPDWCFAEVSKHKMVLPPTPEQYKEMYEKSPISKAHKTQFPIMFFISEKDKRILPLAGLHYYKVMKSCGIEAKAYVYADEIHMMTGHECTRHTALKTLEWFEEHMNK